MSSVPETIPPSATPPEVSIVRPSSSAEFECVDPNGRFIICDVNAWFDGFEASGIFGRVYAESEPIYTGQTPDPLCNGNFFIVPASPPRKKWRNMRLTLSPFVTACADSAPFPQLTVKVWAYRNGLFSTAAQTFSAKCCTPTIATSAEAEYLVSSVAAPTPTTSVPSVPGSVELHYRNLQVNNMFVGNRLMLPGGMPLRASSIEVIARRVNWWSGGRHIHRCLGNGLLATTSDWRFPNTFEYSVVVFQPAVEYQMVLSQSRDRFQVMDLDPNYDIHVLVNDEWAGYENNSGTFDLIIRAIS